MLASHQNNFWEVEMSKTEEYKQEKRRLASIFPEYPRLALSPPRPYSHYVASYRNHWSASRMWRGRVQYWAHLVDCIRSKEYPSPKGEMAIIQEMGFAKAFSPEAQAARLEAAEKRLIARQPTSAGARIARKQGRDVWQEAGEAMAKALAYDVPDGPLPWGDIDYSRIRGCR